MIIIPTCRLVAMGLEMELEDIDIPPLLLSLDYLPKEPLTTSYTYITPIPQSCLDEPVILGVDEAGRGPVMGPMVYGIAFIPASKQKELKDIGVDDSKVLTDEIRCDLLAKIQNADYIGWAIHVGSPQDISAGMLRGAKYNLNAQAHDTTINLIQHALSLNVNICEIYVDTVGPPDQYRIKLETFFPGKKIVVAKKADSLYPIVSAASICAKVSRDKIMDQWKFVERGLNLNTDFGSGYPSDPRTTDWLQENIDSFFGFPRLVRFSWMTCIKILEDHCAKVTWHDELVNKDGPDIRKFFGKRKSRTDNDESASSVYTPEIVQTERENWIKDLTGLDRVESL